MTASTGLQRSTMCIPRLELPDSAVVVSGGNIQQPGRYQFGNRSSSWCALPVNDLQFGGNAAFGGGNMESSGRGGHQLTFQRRASDRDVPNNAAWENELSVQYHGQPERRNSADNRENNYRSWDRRRGGGGRNHQYNTQRSAESLLPTDGVGGGLPNNDVTGGKFVAENAVATAAAVTANTKIDFCKIVAATVRKETGVRMIGAGCSTPPCHVISSSCSCCYNYTCTSHPPAALVFILVKQQGFSTFGMYVHPS